MFLSLLLILTILLMIGQILALYWVTRREGFEEEVRLVVSRYNESVDWLKDPPFSNYPVTLYNKGPNEDFYQTGTVVPLENVGREGHTYLYHIVANYDHLSDITVFLPGSLNMPHKMETGKELIQEIETRKQAVFLGRPTSLEEMYDFSLEEYAATTPENHSINQESKLVLSRTRPFGQWFEERFETLTHWSPGSIFSVSKKDVLQHPKSYYETLLEEVSHSSNPEAGHYLERSWQAVFSMKDTVIL